MKKINFRFPSELFMKKKKQAPGDVIYSPAEISTTGSRITGTALRSVILFLGIFGLSAFLLDFCGLTYNEIYWAGFYVSPWYVALCATAVAAVFGFSSYSKKSAAITIPVSLVLLAVFSTLMCGDPYTFIYKGALRIYNFTLYTMVSRGFMYFGDYMVSDGYDYSAAAYAVSDNYRMAGVFLVTAVIGILLGLAVIKKIRLWLLIPTAAVILVPVLIFNMSHSTLGFAFTLAFLAACVTVYVYDYRFAGSLEGKHARMRKRLEKKQAKALACKARREEKRRLQEEADRILMAALKADMGQRKSRLARKAVFKADKLAKKNAKRSAAINTKAEKKQKKLEAKAEKNNAKMLKRSAAAGDSSAKEALADKARAKAQAKAEKKAAKVENKRLKREKNRRSQMVSAAGGFAGIGAAAVALIAVGLPALVISKPFPEITSVYNNIKIVNTYVTAYLSGNDIDLNDLSAYGIEELMPRSLTFDALEFEQKEMFKVTTTGENNVYLKSWVGDSYDYGADTWNGADYDKVLAFRQKFGQDFTPDDITTAFKSYVYPSTTQFDDDRTVYKNFSKFGFYMQSVDVYRLSGYSRLLAIPSAMDTDIGLLEMNTMDEIRKKYSVYYDGLYSSRFFEAGDGYRTVSYISRMNRVGVGAEIANAQRYYEKSVEHIEAVNDAVPESYGEVVTYNEYILQQTGITYVGTSMVDRYFNQMSDEEKTAFNRSVYLERLYREYVKENYTSSFGSEKISALAAELEAQANEAGIDNTHDKVVSVIDYLGDNCTYTLTPNSEAYDGSGSVLDAFVFDVKEGYCTHFATAACAILREMGIPVRFAEGYIATDYSEVRGYYESTVLDENAHAWIEVYYDGIGWIAYETTPEYADDMYAPDGATFEPVDPNTGETPTVTPPPEEEDDDEPVIIPDEEEPQMSELERVLIIFGAIVLFVILFLIGRLIVKRFIRRGLNMLDARYDLIKRARDEDVFKDPKTDRRDIARRLNDQILQIFEVIGMGPEPGEVSSEYAKRIAQTYGDLSKIDPQLIFAIIQKEEFGNGLNYKETALLAEYLADITASVYAGLSRIQKIKYRYIMRKI